MRQASTWRTIPCSSTWPDCCGRTTSCTRTKCTMAARSSARLTRWHLCTDSIPRLCRSRWNLPCVGLKSRTLSKGNGARRRRTRISSWGESTRLKTGSNRDPRDDESVQHSVQLNLQRCIMTVMDCCIGDKGRWRPACHSTAGCAKWRKACRVHVSIIY